MKAILILFICSVSFTLSAQTPAFENKGLKNDSIKVVYGQNQKRIKLPSYFVNNIYAGKYIHWINPKDVIKLEIIKSSKEKTLHSGQFSGEIHITLVDSVKFRLISLVDISKKYIRHPLDLCVFMINNKLFEGDVEDCLIDENSVLSIEVSSMATKNIRTGKNIEFEVIEILLKTKENIEKSKEIRIRGKE